MNTMTEQNRIRSAKFYELNKEAINAKRREKRALKKAVPIAEELSYDELITKFNELTFTNEKTKLKYLDDIKRLYTIGKFTNFISILKIPAGEPNMLLNIEATDFSTWTKIGLYQMILILIDRLKLDVDKAPYVKALEISKIKVTDETKEKQEVPIMSFAEYLEKVKEQPKLFMIASLYNELTLRDDFVLKIVSNKTEIPDDTQDSFIVINQKSKKANIIIYKYKTEKKYGVIDVKLSMELTKQLKEYIAKWKIVDYLFGDQPLTKFVSKNNKKLGITGAISLFRKMKVSDLLNKEDVTPEERYALSLEMKHSPAVQLSSYFHKKSKKYPTIEEVASQIDEYIDNNNKKIEELKKQL
jgi:hypothetical protein